MDKIIVKIRTRKRRKKRRGFIGITQSFSPSPSLKIAESEEGQETLYWAGADGSAPDVLSLVFAEGMEDDGPSQKNPCFAVVHSISVEN